MALSADFTLDLTLNDLIEESYEQLQSLGDGEPFGGNMLGRAKRTLNLMLKSWEAGGSFLWITKQGTLFPVVGQHIYDFATANLSNTWFETQIATAASSGASTITVDSDSNIQNSDKIQVLLDDNTAQWTTVNGAPAANVVTLTDVLTGDVAVDAFVRNYRDTFAPVSRIIDVRRRDSATSEIPIIFESKEEYFNQVNKESPGSAIQAYYSRTLPFGTFYMWGEPDSAVPLVNFTYDRQLQIMTVPGDFYDLPDYWFAAIVWNLAEWLIPKVGCTPARAIIIEKMAAKTLASAYAFDTTLYPIKMVMGRRG